MYHRGISTWCRNALPRLPPLNPIPLVTPEQTTTLEQKGMIKVMLIYVCSPKEDTRIPAQTKFICYLIAKRGHVPIAPRLYFPQFIHSDTRPLSAELLSLCDEMWVIGPTTDPMKDEMEMALKEQIPIRHFINMDVMAGLLEKGAVPSADMPVGDDVEREEKSRSFDELMGELVKVNNEEESKEIIEFAYAKARAIEPRTHMDRGVVEKLIFVYNSLLHDMDKVEMTEEEGKLLMREGLNSIAEQLHIDSRLAAAIIRMAEEDTKDDGIVDVITQYCAEHAPGIAKATGLPQSLVDKIIFISNTWRWRDRKEITFGNFDTWCPKHIKELANLLGQSEDVIRQVLDAELTDT